MTYAGSSGSSGLSAPYPHHMGFIEGLGTSVLRPLSHSKFSDFMATGTTSLAPRLVGPGGLAATSAWIMRVALGRKACGRIVGSKRGMPFGRAGVSHRPGVRVARMCTRRHAVYRVCGVVRQRHGCTSFLLACWGVWERRGGGVVRAASSVAGRSRVQGGALPHP